MMRVGEGEGRWFALNCGPTSEQKRKTKRVPFGERRGGSSMPGCNANATRAMYSQNRLTGRHRNHYSHQNLRCSAYASHCPKTKRLDAERADAALIDALLQAEP